MNTKNKFPAPPMFPEVNVVNRSTISKADRNETRNMMRLDVLIVVA
jgi:hypothetical protein